MAQKFDGFGKDLLRFLRALQKNNERDWFQANKTTYEAAFKAPAAQFCDVMEDELQELTGHIYKSKVFRLHRDLRFSKDKTPYNTHLHISWTPQGVSGVAPMWMFGLEPGDLTVGVGIFQFEKDHLASYRERVAGEPGVDLAKALARLTKGGARLSEPDLKRVPKEYDAGHPRSDLLRHKGLAVWSPFEGTSAAEGASLVKDCRARFRKLLPVFEWLREVG